MRREIWIGDLVILDRNMTKLGSKHGVHFEEIRSYLICRPGIYAQFKWPNVYTLRDFKIGKYRYFIKIKEIDRYLRIFALTTAFKLGKI